MHTKNCCWIKIKTTLVKQINEIFEVNYTDYEDINWENLIERFNIEVFSDFCEEFLCNLPPEYTYFWLSISSCEHLDEEFLLRFQNKLDWYCISRFVDLAAITPQVCCEVGYRIQWRELLIRHGADLEFIKSRLGYIPYDDIIYYSWVTLPEDLVEKMIPTLSIGAINTLALQRRFSKELREKLKRKICV